MWYAALHGNTSIMKALCEPFDTNSGTDAIANGSIASLNSIININELKFDWDKLINKCKRDTGYNVFHLICENGYLDCLKYLCKLHYKFNTKMDICAPVKQSGNTGFLLACSTNHWPVMEYLIRDVYGIYSHIPNVDINGTNKSGRSAIWFCCWNGVLK